MSRANGLARFRVDPRKVRVSIRRFGPHRWRAEVKLRDPDALYRGRIRAIKPDPAEAIDAALARAEHVRMPGIDRGMGWAYEHPWGVAGVIARVDNDYEEDEEPS